MDHEIFVLPRGDHFTAREIVYSEWSTSTVIHRCTPGGKDLKKTEGQLEVTIETATIRFIASPGPLAVDQVGQFSCADDRFHEVTILALQHAPEGILVTGRAKRTLGWKLLD